MSSPRGLDTVYSGHFCQLPPTLRPDDLARVRAAVRPRPLQHEPAGLAVDEAEAADHAGAAVPEPVVLHPLLALCYTLYLLYTCLDTDPVPAPAILGLECRLYLPLGSPALGPPEVFSGLHRHHQWRL